MINRKRASWFDLCIALGILVLCAGLFLGIFQWKKNQATYGVLYYNNEEIARYDLSIDASYEPDLTRFPGLVIVVKNGAICFSENDCPDQICVHTGYLKVAGTYAVCVPYRLKLAVEGTSSEVDN